MSPLLDLDDDAIAATLSFTDPRSLCSTTMTCRRLRRLADAAWPELDKHLESNKREGGNTPRERVLSSFVVHSNKEMIGQIVRHHIDDMQEIIPTELASRDHLIYLRICNPRELYGTFIGASAIISISRDAGSVDIPLQREHAKGDLKFALSQWTIAPPGILEEIFQYATINIFAFDRQTLSPRNLINEEDLRSDRVPSMKVSKSSNGSNRTEVTNNWAKIFINRNNLLSRDAAPFTRTRIEVGFYFQDDESFGLIFHKHSSNAYE